MNGRCTAKFHAQAWINDYAVEIDDGCVEFDITDLILAMAVETALAIKDDHDESDDLWWDSKESSRHYHNGPFWVECHDAIREFLASLGHIETDTP